MRDRKLKRRVIMTVLVGSGMLFVATALNNSVWESTSDLPGIIGVVKVENGDK